METAEPSNATGATEAVSANPSSTSLPVEVKVAPLSGRMSRFARNSAANVFRLVVVSLIGILLPAYLTHHLPVATYGAWVLVLQLGAYVGYLDFGVQTAIAKYIAEFEARQDFEGCGRCASAGFMIILAASAIGILLTGVLAWRVPELFRNMPPDLQGGARYAIVLVGASLSISLAASVFSAIFLGLQRYEIPMGTTVATRLLYASALGIAVATHSSLVVMGAAVAAANVAGAALQVWFWKRLAAHIQINLRAIDFITLRRMLGYCAVLTIWSMCMLFITGIDVTVVGHYAFGEVAFYSIAAAPTTLILTVIGALLGPLLPAASALSVERSPREMGAILLRTTRYSTLILLVTGLPLMMAGYELLRLWVGQDYALHSIRFLQILLLANILRNLCGPYATMVVAVSRQRAATAPAITEAVVNLSSSIWLARHYGAMGVALGTLIGSAVSVAMLFGISMGYTQVNFAIPRRRLLAGGIVRPASMAVPSALLLPMWWRTGPPSLTPALWIGWAISTGLLAWFVGLSRDERVLLKQVTTKRMTLALRRAYGNDSSQTGPYRRK
jgi:O-antigen/teichoic acid export membrane protein